MKKITISLSVLIIISVSLIGQSIIVNSSGVGDHDNHLVPDIQPDQSNSEIKGVVVVDNSHNNDYYSDSNLDLMINDLIGQGYVLKLVSDFPTFSQALDAANYFVMSAPNSAITQNEIDNFVGWFASTSANLLIASRGDFSTDFERDSVNNLLSALGATMQVQDDNVYTTDPSQRNPWYVGTAEFNSGFPSIFEGVNGLNFFSPSSIIITPTSDVLVYGDPRAYQTNQNGNPADVIYDDTDDGVGGDTIPLSVLEKVNVGNYTDRIITVGTTMWADFDYSDLNYADTTFFNNILQYFREETINEMGAITINLPDLEPPLIKISSPHPDAVLQNTVSIEVEAIDPFGIDTYQISINREFRSSSSSYIWDTTLEENGNYVIEATATDPSGNTGLTSVNYRIQQGYIPTLRETAKVMEYNIKQSGQLPAWMDVMKEENGDIIMLVETGDFDNNNNQLLEEVIEELNTYFFDEIPYKGYALQNIQRDFDGITILSRFEIKDTNKISRVTKDDGSKVDVPLPFLHAELSINDFTVNLIGGHLSCCGGDENKQQRADQQEGIINYFDGLGDEPIIYLGDMNAESQSDVRESDLGTEPIAMITDPTHPKSSVIHTFVDVHDELNPGKTVYSFIGSTFGRIDYIFVNQWFTNTISNSTTGDTFSANIASDHTSVDVLVNFSQLNNYVVQNPPEDNKSTDDNPISFPFSPFLVFATLIILIKKTKDHSKCNSI